MSVPTITIRTEAWIKSHLRAPTLFDGVTTQEDRKRLLRDYLREHDMGLVIAGRAPSGNAETWGQVFRRLYGCDL